MEISYTLTRAHGARIATMQKDVRLYTVKAGSKDKNGAEGLSLVVYLTDAAVAKLPDAKRFDLPIDDGRLFFTPNEANGYKISGVSKAQGARTIRVSLSAHPKEVTDYLLPRLGDYELHSMRAAGETVYYIDLKKQDESEEEKE